MSRSLAIAATLAAAWLAGCAARTTSDRDLQLVDVQEACDLVEGSKVLFGLAGTKIGVFVDPRTEQSYRQGHIPGAVSLPFQYVAAQHEALRRYDVVVVYGAHYNDEVADGMSKRLMELGLRDVRTLVGGLRAWHSAGRQLTTGPDP